MLTQAELQEALSYDPDTGLLKWKYRPGKNGRIFDGMIAGTPQDDSGRIQITIKGRVYRAHRLVWLHVYGYMPDANVQIDHINGDPSDNRISNLRLATASQNLQNTGLFAHNKTGYRGVSIHKQTGKYRARIKLNQHEKSLGLFDTPEAAYSARRAAELVMFTHSKLHHEQHA
jgi:hypothetical protein